MPDSNGAVKDYETQQLWNLRVTDRPSLDAFMGLVTMRPSNVAKFDALTATKTKNYEGQHKFTALVKEITADGAEDVYDTTVDVAHALTMNSFVSGNCSEILQVSEPSVINDRQEYEVLGKDISCNLGSLNISRVMDGGNIAKTVDTAIRALTTVSDTCVIEVAPTINAGNRRSHAVGLGQMNLHGFLSREGIPYDSPEAVDFTDAYFRTVNYWSLVTSSKIAKERKETFDGFERSKYATGEAFEEYIAEGAYKPSTAKVRALLKKYGVQPPQSDDWEQLTAKVKRHGLFHQNRLAVAPTGSISYVNYATASIHPITSLIEARKEGKMGRVYYPAAHLTDENRTMYKDAYEIGWKALIDVYAAATRHVDQGLSLTLFFTEDATTRELNQAQIYAWKKGIKTLYYVRVKSSVLDGTDQEGCVSCAV